MINKFNINNTYIGHIKIGRATGAYPLFSFAVSDYKSLCNTYAVSITFEDMIGTRVVGCDDVTELDKWNVYRLLKNQNPGIFIVNVADQDIHVREDLIGEFLESIENYIIGEGYKDEPYIAMFSRCTYEDRLTFFIFKLSKFNEDDRTKLICGIMDENPDEFYVTNFNWDFETHSITSMKNIEAEDVDDSEESDEESE